MKLLALVAALLVTIAALPADAAGVYDRPVYNPDTNSYFVLKRGLGSGRWADALSKAPKTFYKGVRGRLAVIPDAKTDKWVYKNLQLSKLGDVSVWMGMRYWCRHRKLMFSNGDIHPLKAYSNWRRPWYRQKKTNCPKWWGSRGFMGVTIQSKTGKWMAAGMHKGFQNYIVEYPMDKKKEEKKAE